MIPTSNRVHHVCSRQRRGGWARILAIVALAAGVGMAGAGFAAPKPPPPPPVVQPGSTIFFKHQTTGDIYRMDDNGGNKALVVSFDWQVHHTFAAVYNGPGELVPSSKKYNGQHWWAWVGYREDGATYPFNDTPICEIYVGVPGVVAYRLTNLWDDYKIYFSAPSEITWSTDGGDTFLSFVGYRYTDPKPRAPSVYKIPFLVQSVSGQTVPVKLWDAGYPTIIEAQIPLPGFDPDDPARPYYPNTDRHTWLPTDGETLLYRTVSNEPDAYIVRLFRRSVLEVDAGLPATLLWTNDRSSASSLGAQYSPDGGTIAFARFRSFAERDVLTIPADSTDLVGISGTTTILTGKNMGYGNPVWSPNGAYLIAYELDGRKGIDASKFPRHIIRVTNAGGSLVRLTSDMSPTGHKYILGWCHGASGDPAP